MPEACGGQAWGSLLELLEIDGSVVTPVPQPRPQPGHLPAAGGAEQGESWALTTSPFTAMGALLSPEESPLAPDQLGPFSFCLPVPLATVEALDDIVYDASSYLSQLERSLYSTGLNRRARLGLAALHAATVRQHSLLGWLRELLQLSHSLLDRLSYPELSSDNLAGALRELAYDTDAYVQAELRMAGCQLRPGPPLQQQLAGEGASDLFRLQLLHSALHKMEAAAAQDPEAGGQVVQYVELLLGSGRADGIARHDAELPEEQQALSRALLLCRTSCGADLAVSLLRRGFKPRPEMLLAGLRQLIECAAEPGRVGIARAVLAQIGASAGSELDSAALMLAMGCGFPSVVDALVRHSLLASESEAPVPPFDVLHLAMRFDPDQLGSASQLLLHCGSALVRHGAALRVSCLEALVQAGHWELGTLMLRHGAPVEPTEGPPLAHLAADRVCRCPAAAAKGYIDGLVQLVLHGVDVDAEHEGWTVGVRLALSGADDALNWFWEAGGARAGAELHLTQCLAAIRSKERTEESQKALSVERLAQMVLSSNASRPAPEELGPELLRQLNQVPSRCWLVLSQSGQVADSGPHPGLQRQLAVLRHSPAPQSPGSLRPRRVSLPALDYEGPSVELTAAITHQAVELVPPLASQLRDRRALQEYTRSAMRRAVQIGAVRRQEGSLARERLGTLQSDLGEARSALQGTRQRAAVSMLGEAIAETEAVISQQAERPEEEALAAGVVRALLEQLRARCSEHGIEEGLGCELVRHAVAIQDTAVLEAVLRCVHQGQSQQAVLHMLVLALVGSPEGARQLMAPIRKLLKWPEANPCRVDQLHTQSPLLQCVNELAQIEPTEAQLEAAAVLISHASAEGGVQQQAIEWGFTEAVRAARARDASRLVVLRLMLESTMRALAATREAQCSWISRLTDKGRAAMEMACEAGMLQVATLLLDLGADCTSPRLFGLVVRSTSAQGELQGWAALWPRIQQHGGDLSADGNLESALQAGEMELLNMLLGSGCDLRRGAPVCDILQEMQEIRASALVDGVEVGASERWRFLQAALDSLLEAGAAVRQPSSSGYTALDLALCVGEPEVVWLIELGGARRGEGYPLHALLSMLNRLVAAQGLVAESEPWEQHCDYLRTTARSMDAEAAGTPPSALISTVELAQRCGEAEVAVVAGQRSQLAGAVAPTEAIHTGDSGQAQQSYRPQMNPGEPLRYQLGFSADCKVAVVTSGTVPADLVAMFYGESTLGTKPIAQLRLNGNGKTDVLVQCLAAQSPLIVELVTRQGWAEARFSVAFKASSEIFIKPLV